MLDCSAQMSRRSILAWQCGVQCMPTNENVQHAQNPATHKHVALYKNSVQCPAQVDVLKQGV